MVDCPSNCVVDTSLFISGLTYDLLRVLKLIQPAINTLTIQQLLVAALLHDASFVQHDDAIHVANR